MSTHYQKLLDKYGQTKPFRMRENAPERPLEAPIRRWVLNPNYVHGGTEPYGGYEAVKMRRNGNHAISLADTGDLDLLYYKSKAATLHPDGSVTLYPTSYGGDGMISGWVPKGLRPNSSKGPLAFLGTGDEPINFWGRDKNVATARVTPLEWSGTTFRMDDEGLWQRTTPADHPWVIERIDRAKAREVSKRYHLADFANWFNAVATLTDDKLVSEGLDNHEAAVEALLRRDFPTAFHNLEPVQRKIYGWAPYWQNGEAKVTKRSIERLRLRLYDDYDAVITEKHDVLMVPEWRNRVLSNPCRAT